METEIMEDLYQKVANQINQMIPEAWDRVLLYAEVSEAGGTTFFYYYPEGKDEPIYCHDVPKLFEFPQMEFRSMNAQLYRNFRSLRQEFISNHQEPWTNLTLTLNSTGSFEIKYGYEDLSEANEMATKVIWAYKQMGIVPNESDKYRKFLFDEYLKNQAQSE